MIIGIDGNEANVEMRVGVHQYSFEILWALYRLQNSQKYKHRFVIYLKKRPSGDLPPEKNYWKYKILPGGKLWVLTKLNKELLFGEKIDIFFTPSHYLPFLTTMPKVCTIHDLGYLKYSAHFKNYDFWQLKYWTAISIIVSKYIITFSDFSKQDIVRHYRFASNKIVITHHGYDIHRYHPKISQTIVRRVNIKYGINSKYILFLGTLKPSKNIEGLINAYNELEDDTKQNYKLVIAGKRGWLYKTIFEKVKKLMLEDKVVFTDFVSEEDKPALYAGSSLFVNASFWEGFGMQVLEAMACGKPVVVSNIASLPEVAGNAGTYVNPKKPREIAKGINKVLTLSKVDYNKLSRESLSQAQKFSWVNSAKGVLSVFEKIKL